MKTHLEKADALALQITELEARVAGLREQAHLKPFPTKKGSCGHCGGPRPYRARACATCTTRVAALKAEIGAVLATIATLRAEYAIAARSTDELVDVIHTLQAAKPRGWRAREHGLEVEIVERFWEGVPAGPDTGTPAESPLASATA